MPKIHGLFSETIPLQNLLDEIPQGAMILDLNRKVLAVNRALEALVGVDCRMVRGVACAYVMRNSLCLENCPLEQGDDLGEGCACCLDGNILNRDRQKVPVRITLAPLMDESGGCRGYLETMEKREPAAAWPWQHEHSVLFGHLVGNSPQMEHIFKMLPMVAQTDSSVLITGETGTGKDIIAEAIHLASDRAKGAFIKVNCGALPETLLESELFGHQKGAFTGATENKPGRFKLAHNGTFFLTEIGDLPLGLQTKLLTFLDDKTVFPLGSTQGSKVNVRIIAATLRDLEAMVRCGQFRSDLLFRLNVIRIHLPPLRERVGDVRLLLDQFLRTFAEKAKKKIAGFSAEALAVLSGYDYPGNVRELKNIVESVVTFCNADMVQSEHLPDYVRKAERRAGTWSEDLVKAGAVLPRSAEPPGDRGERKGPEPSTSSFSMPTGTWKDMEKQMILEALRQAKGHRGHAAEILGWGRSTLWRKMKALGMDQ